MKTAFLCNLSDRWGKKAQEVREQIDHSFPQEQETFIVNRNETHSTEKHLEKIVRDKFDRIVVAGGDGSLNRVVNFLQRSQCLDRFTFGVIPLGTCNDFARYLGLPAGKIEPALQVVLENQIGKVALAKVERCFFINNAGFGKRNPTNKRASGVSVIRAMQPVKVEVRWLDQRLEESLYMMLCANAPYFSGGLHFSRSSDPQDKLLEFFFVKEISKARLLLKLLLGRAHLPLHFPPLSKNIVRIQCSHLSLRTQQPVAIVTDGEAIPELTDIKEATFETAGSLNFLIPKRKAIFAAR